MADETADVPYQQAPQVAQLRAERENAVAYGQETRVAAVDKQLDALGIQEKKAAAEKRKAAADDSDDADESKKRSTPPQGRSAKPTQKS